MSRIIRQSNRNWLKRYSNPIYPKNAISIFKDWSMKRSNPSFVAENCQTFFCFELKQNWNWIECIKKNKRKCSLAMSSLASWICQIYQIPKKDRGFYGLLNLSKFIKYQRRREYFAVCWICPILNQYQRRTPGKVYFLLRIHEPQDTPVQFRPINAGILKVLKLQVTPHPRKCWKDWQIWKQKKEYQVSQTW